MANKTDRFTNDARKVLLTSQEFAKEAGHYIIEPYHLLLAMCRDKSLICANLLEKYELIEEKLLPPLRIWFPADETNGQKEIDLSDELKKCLAYSVDEARRMGHHRITSAHLLCGLLRMKSPTMQRIYEHFSLETLSLLDDARSTAHEALTGIADVNFTWMNDHDVSFFDRLRQSLGFNLGLRKKKKNDE